MTLKEARLDFRLDPDVLLRLISLLAGDESTSKANLVALDPDFVPFTCALTTALCGKAALMEVPGDPAALTALAKAKALKK